MGIENRPYVGTWRLNQKQVVQHTPDALVFINGDTALPGCPKCKSKIDIQQFLTEVSVDAGTQPGSMSCTMSLSIPIHHQDATARDARYLLRPGLEVQVYMRGYFPVKGLYQTLAEPTLTDPLVVSNVVDQALATAGFQPVGQPTPVPTTPGEYEGTKAKSFAKEIDLNSDAVRALIDKWGKGSGFTDPSKFPEGAAGDAIRRETVLSYARAEVIERYWKQTLPDAQVGIMSHYRTNSKNHITGGATDIYITYNGGKNTVPMLQTWGSTRVLMDKENGRIPPGGSGCYLYVEDGQVGALEGVAFDPNNPQERRLRVLPPGGSTGTHVDDRGGSYGRYWLRISTNKDDKSEYASDSSTLGDPYAYLKANGFEDVAAYVRVNGTWKNDPSLPPPGPNVPNLNQVLGIDKFNAFTEAPPEPEPPQVIEVAPAEESSFQPASEIALDPPAPVVADGPNFLEEAGLGTSGLEDILAYPYYPVFHGVVTRVDHSYSGGVQSVSVACSSMLHFWSYHNMSTNASQFGARPSNSKLKVSMVGHNFTGMHPYEIMYSLYHDTAGAAGSVGWHLRDKTNVAAKSELNGESLFSLNIKYWEKRFNQGFNKLRMHGATGELFSAAQAQFLSRLSSNKLVSLIKGRFNDPQTQKESGDKILSQAASLNLFGKNKLESLLWAQKNRPTASGGSGLEINLADMQAYVSNLGNWGQVNLFEATYETKLDVAQKVMQITNFEFYQDMDGDYVFKPPFYNMDTSSSRVYRIEEIDIISMSFSESEPEVTYITLKTGVFKNLQVSGLDGEWGNRGQYIDYRLVAQFGWRPSNWESEYLNDPKALFYAAVSRMDVLNINRFSASVSIPLRPEMRPGYPVFIKCQNVDAFYYCASFSHAFSWGGQCTTSLQLAGRRAKFFPPGDPNKLGIDAVDLSNPYFPERPLEINTPDGPKLAGFPNVVMALDPTKLNPLFSIVGSDMEDLTNPGTLANLFDMANSLGIVSSQVVDPRNPDFVIYTAKLPSNPDDPTSGFEEVKFSLNEEEIGAKKKKGAKSNTPEGTINAAAAAQAYENRLNEGGDKVAESGQQATNMGNLIVEKSNKITALNTELAALDPNNPDHEKVIKERQLEVQILTAEIDGYKTDKVTARHEFIDSENPSSGVTIPKSLLGRLSGEAKAAKLKTLGEGLRGQLNTLQTSAEQSRVDLLSGLREADELGVAALLRLVDELGTRFRKKNPDYANLDSTSNLLDMLSDKKATFSNGTQPGAYRYYSASHPDPDQQGQPLWDYVQDEGGQRVKITAPSLEGKWQGVKVEGFLPEYQVAAAQPGEKRPEAALGDVYPSNGIRILTNSTDPALKRGEIVPTSEIRELSFSIQKVNVTHPGNSTFRTVKAASLGAKALKAIQDTFIVGTVDPEQSLSDLYGVISWDYLREQVKQAAIQAETKARAAVGHVVPNFPNFTEPDFPLTVVIKGNTVDVQTPLSEVQTLLASAGVSAQAETWSVQQIAELCGRQIGSSFQEQLARSRAAWIQSVNALDDKTLSKQDKEMVFGVLNSALAAGLGVESLGKIDTTQLEAVKGRNKFTTNSPVFPVSDAAGYEVIGGYRYGRDIAIEANNPLDTLHRQDPLSMLSADLVAEVLDYLANSRGGSKTQTVQTHNSRGRKGSTKVQQDTTIAGINAKALAQLRVHLTDTQIVDFGLADRNTANPSLIEFNLMNWFAEDSKEGISKIPILNAAISLADLTRNSGASSCTCKAAEANVLLESLSNEDYLNFAPGSYTETATSVGQNDLTSFLQTEAAKQGVPWQQSQMALRGQVMDRAGSNLLETFSGAIKDLKGAAEATREATDKFISDVQALQKPEPQ